MDSKERIGMECKLCGAKNISPSMGGRDICPACDCYPPDIRKVQIQYEKRLIEKYFEAQKLRKEVEQLKFNLKIAEVCVVPLTAKVNEKFGIEDSLKNEITSLRSVLEKAIKALEYCAVEPGILHLLNNRQCAVAQNALQEIKGVLDK